MVAVAGPLVLLPRPGVGDESTRVELELVLAVDTSISVDSHEFALQIDGLARAFRDPNVIAAIKDAGEEGIAVSVVQWGVGLEQRVAVDWTRIRDAASAESFASEIERLPRFFSGNGTAITRAIAYSSKLFLGNGLEGRRRVIDVSGDGRNNSGAHPAAIRDRVVSNGIVINGLAILDGDLSLGAYFEENVTGGPASFVIVARTFDDFAAAMREKLLREIAIPMARAPDFDGFRITSAQ